ncbi:Asp-tRNA(Asn)/Glu-tRNA(Gln) amidotransferase subunit GatA [Candidatus Nitrosotalea okcheonensis]|uniref:Glutamyl-tRNA(Gln) amidotransferase subunit A n=1 Tax=Candidatus Nitrosotalea okcheonensis TaxID=1903276 RepID=A0A2H1FD69_9ARCH|nr:Asp-tRNA(Asn)/Glu-tRNA(Gln) amidotransferase subunit GatA [Candidatus Nitrosotalea okcheonensis]SMH70713.1 Glutamyl-tRNA(Gln) amidotransferase subunit A [Candidatus Nitrosotalea okcheonensis]
MNLGISATEFTSQVKEGSISVEEFVAKTLDRIEKVDEQIHAFITVDSQNALEKARILDKKIKSKEKIGICFGLPMSVKDNICTAGLKTTCASKMLENFVAPYDATVISKLKSEDAIIIGKVNLDEFAMGSTTEFSHFGPTRNPWNIGYVPGGSSGGSGASVAALECLAALGSDTGGSVRSPASFCSVVGLKPTYGLISRYGLVSYANSIEQIGPMAKTVEDVAFLLNIISGHDIHDNTTSKNARIDYVKDLKSGISGKKIGIISQMTGDGVDKEVESATNDAISKLQDLGAQCIPVSLDAVEHSVAAYYTIAAAEASSNLSRYDNLRYGFDFGIEGYEFKAFISKARGNFGPEVVRRMLLGAFVLSAGYYGKYYLKAQKIRAMIKTQLDEAFKNVDYLISPTMPVLPFKIGEKIDDPLKLYLTDINTVTANLSGIPAISIPFAMSSSGLPIGIQLFANSFKEKELLQAAYALQETTKLPGITL